MRSWSQVLSLHSEILQQIPGLSPVTSSIWYLSKVKLICRRFIVIKSNHRPLWVSPTDVYCVGVCLMRLSWYIKSTGAASSKLKTKRHRPEWERYTKRLKSSGFFCGEIEGSARHRELSAKAAEMFRVTLEAKEEEGEINRDPSKRCAELFKASRPFRAELVCLSSPHATILMQESPLLQVRDAFVMNTLCTMPSGISDHAKSWSPLSIRWFYLTTVTSSEMVGEGTKL